MNELYEARRAILAALDGTTAIAVRVLGVSRRRGEDDPDQMLSLLADSARCLAGSLHGLLVAVPGALGGDKVRALQACIPRPQGHPRALGFLLPRAYKAAFGGAS
jgi:hypothetical protein